MNNFNQRPVLKKIDHPINSGRYAIRTPMINTLANQMRIWVENRTTGAIISGRQRLGKTQAIKFTRNLLEREFDGIVIVTIPCRHEKSSTEKGFFSYLLLCVDHALHEVKRCDSSVLRHRLNEYLKMKVENSGLPWILFFLDDAQRLNENQYAWLMDIHNELHSSGIHLGCYLFGQPELLHQKSAFVMAKKQHLVSRFMLHEFSFHGITGINEMKYCLKGFDSMLFPLDSEWTFSAYFFPEAYAAGWRAGDLAESFWEAFLEVASKNAFPKKLEIPMEYFARTVEHLFRYHEGKLVHINPITNINLIEAINFTNFGNYHNDIGADAS